MPLLSVSYEVFPNPAEAVNKDQLAQQEGRHSLWTVVTPVPHSGHEIVRITKRMSTEEAKDHCQRLLEKSERQLYPKCKVQITGFSVLPDEINTDS